jgi:CYTH domain-containing protein
VAEVEFSSIEAAESFIPPEWFREEITHDKSFKNQSLARYGNPWSAK